jgi:hypothetical protein
MGGNSNEKDASDERDVGKQCSKILEAVV